MESRDFNDFGTTKEDGNCIIGVAIVTETRRSSGYVR